MSDDFRTSVERVYYRVPEPERVLDPLVSDPRVSDPRESEPSLVSEPLESDPPGERDRNAEAPLLRRSISAVP